MKCRQKDGCTRTALCPPLGVCFWNAMHEKPKAQMAFEDALGVFIHEWLTLSTLDEIIQGVDEVIVALEIRRDVELNKD